MIEQIGLLSESMVDKADTFAARIAGVVDNLAQVFDKIVPLRVAAGQFADLFRAV